MVIEGRWRGVCKMTGYRIYTGWGRKWECQAGKRQWKSGKIMGLRSTENKITRGREFKELEAGEWKESSMG